MTDRVRYYGFVTVLLAMVLFLFGMSGYHYYVQRTGTVVRLKTEPIDPRSLFRGDYVRLNYTINRLQRKGPNLTAGEIVYVILETTGSHWSAESVHRKHPGQLGSGRAVIRGTYEESRNGEARISYPSIESYFVPEGTGSKLETFRGEGLSVEVALGSEGYPVIKRLIVPESR